MRGQTTLILPVSFDFTIVAASDHRLSPATTVWTVPAQVADPAAAAGFAAGAAGLKYGVDVAAECCLVVAPTPVATPARPGATSALDAWMSARKGLRGACVGAGAATPARPAVVGAADGGAVATTDGVIAGPSASVPMARARG